MILNSYKSLKLSQNKKTAAHKNHLNTYGCNPGRPEDGGTCPKATSGKGGCLYAKNENGTPTCYAFKVKRLYPNASKTLQYNTDLVENSTYEELVDICRNTIIKFLLHNNGKDQFFRHFYSGDWHREKFVDAWCKIMREWPTVQFWGYTRSWHFLPKLAEVSNMASYLSLDPQNVKEVMAAYEPYRGYHNVALAAMGDVPEGIDEKFIACPEITNKHLKSGTTVNCVNCKLCFSYNDKIKLRNIRFPIH